MKGQPLVDRNKWCGGKSVVISIIERARLVLVVEKYKKIKRIFF